MRRERFVPETMVVVRGPALKVRRQTGVASNLLGLSFHADVQDDPEKNRDIGCFARRRFYAPCRERGPVRGEKFDHAHERDGCSIALSF